MPQLTDQESQRPRPDSGADGDKQCAVKKERIVNIFCSRGPKQSGRACFQLTLRWIQRWLSVVSDVRSSDDD